MSDIRIQKASVSIDAFNHSLVMPYNLKINDFRNTMEDVYDFMFDINERSVQRGWGRFEDMLQLQALSNVLSNIINLAMARHSRELVVNTIPNGHPDLIRRGLYEGNSVMNAGPDEGVEMKATRNTNGAVDMHGAREQDLCTFVYSVDREEAKPIEQRSALKFIGIFLGRVELGDYRKNSRNELGTKTATLDGAGLAKYRQNWVYLTNEMRRSNWCRRELALPEI